VRLNPAVEAIGLEQFSAFFMSERKGYSATIRIRLSPVNEFHESGQIRSLSAKLGLVHSVFSPATATGSLFSTQGSSMNRLSVSADTQAIPVSATSCHGIRFSQGFDFKPAKSLSSQINDFAHVVKSSKPSMAPVWLLKVSDQSALTELGWSRSK